MDLVVDYAGVDGNAPPDLKAAYAAGLRCGIVRASYSAWSDGTAARDADAIRNTGMVFGGYGFPDLDAGAPSMAAQAKAAFDGARPRPGVDLPIAMDVEFARGILATHQGASLLEARLHLAGAVGDYRKALADVQGADPLLYISQRVADTDDTDTLAGAADDAIRGMAAWLARYVLATRAPAETDADYLSRLPAPPVPKAIGGPDDWWFRQYQGDALRFPGFSSTVDCDVFHPLVLGSTGTRVQWTQRRIGATPDGGCGPETVAALLAFQNRAGLVPTGVVNLSTFAKLAWTAPAA
jgi:hypothetical protein